MRLLMNVTKDRNGTYYAIKKVPKHLQGAVARVLGNGKSRQTWLKRSLRTKDVETANRRARLVLTDFDHKLDRAKELLAERPIRDSLTDAEIKLIADRHYAEMLLADDEETREGTGRDEFMRAIAKQLDDAGVEYDMPIPPSENPRPFGLSDSDIRKKVNSLEFEMPIMRAALATGDVSKVSEYLDYLVNGVFGFNWTRGRRATDVWEWRCCEGMWPLWKQSSSELRVSQSRHHRCQLSGLHLQCPLVKL